MAAFTTSLLVGLAVGGGMLAGKKLAKPKAPAAPPVAPGPSAAQTIAAPPPPAPLPQQTSAATATAKGVAATTRKRMAASKNLGLPMGRSIAGARVEPKTLVGSGY